MMNKSVLFFSLLSGTALLPGLVLASGFPTHTPKHTPKQEPVSFIDMAHSYKTAAVCFLGYGDCDPNAGFGSGDENYSIDTAKQCQNEGFSKVNCNSVQVIDGTCPYNSSYGKACKCASNLVTCPAGQVGVGESCGGKYASCQCDPKLVSCASNQVGQGASCGADISPVPANRNMFTILPTVSHQGLYRVQAVGAGIPAVPVRPV